MSTRPLCRTLSFIDVAPSFARYDPNSSPHTLVTYIHCGPRFFVLNRYSPTRHLPCPNGTYTVSHTHLNSHRPVPTPQSTVPSPTPPSHRVPLPLRPPSLTRQESSDLVPDTFLPPVQFDLLPQSLYSDTKVTPPTGVVRLPLRPSWLIFLVDVTRSPLYPFLVTPTAPPLTPSSTVVGPRLPSVLRTPVK